MRYDVDYTILDAFKIEAQRAAKKTGGGPASRGESAFVWEERDCYRAMVIEGLGTKNLVADAMRSITGKTYYDAIAQDTVAMIVNDLITVGAKPQVVNAYFASGNTRWFKDQERACDLIRGWANACRLAGAVWGGGETPTLTGIVESGTIDLAGSAIGVVKPKKRLLVGNAIAHGDAIVLVESSGIHANGLTLCRAIADELPVGYATKLSNGSMYGEALLAPTHIYASLIAALFDAHIDVHYAVHITGHGWRKLMRPSHAFTYLIDQTPPASPLFSFLQKYGKLDDRGMFETFNMGAGFALYVPKNAVAGCIAIAKQEGFYAWHAGSVRQGEKQVVIKPKNIVFSASTLKIRD